MIILYCVLRGDTLRFLFEQMVVLLLGWALKVVRLLLFWWIYRIKLTLLFIPIQQPPYLLAFWFSITLAYAAIFSTSQMYYPSLNSESCQNSRQNKACALALLFLYCSCRFWKLRISALIFCATSITLYILPGWKSILDPNNGLCFLQVSESQILLNRSPSLQ